jgi:hypothetical protein
MQWERTGRRAPSTLAAGDEAPMNPTKKGEACSICSLYDARVCSEWPTRAGVTHSHRPTLYGPGCFFIAYIPARVFFSRPTRMPSNEREGPLQG